MNILSHFHSAPSMEHIQDADPALVQDEPRMAGSEDDRERMAWTICDDEPWLEARGFEPVAPWNRSPFFRGVWTALLIYVALSAIVWAVIEGVRHWPAMH